MRTEQEASTVDSVLRSDAVQNILCWLACSVHNGPHSPKFQILPSQLRQTGPPVYSIYKVSLVRTQEAKYCTQSIGPGPIAIVIFDQYLLQKVGTSSTFCLFVDEKTKGSYPLANGLNGLPIYDIYCRYSCLQIYLSCLHIRADHRQQTHKQKGGQAGREAQIQTHKQMRTPAQPQTPAQTRHRKRQADRQTDRQTVRQISRQADTTARKHRHDRHANRKAGRHARQENTGMIGRQTGKQAGRQTGRQTGRQADRQTCTINKTGRPQADRQTGR